MHYSSIILLYRRTVRDTSIKGYRISKNSGVARVILLGQPNFWHTLRFYSFFNDKVYSMRISVQKSLIKVAIYEIYGIKSGLVTQTYFWGGHGSLSPLATPMPKTLN